MIYVKAAALLVCWIAAIGAVAVTAVLLPKIMIGFWVIVVVAFFYGAALNIVKDRQNKD